MRVGIKKILRYQRNSPLFMDMHAPSVPFSGRESRKKDSSVSEPSGLTPWPRPGWWELLFPFDDAPQRRILLRLDECPSAASLTAFQVAELCQNTGPQFRIPSDDKAAHQCLFLCVFVFCMQVVATGLLFSIDPSAAPDFFKVTLRWRDPHLYRQIDSLAFVLV